MDAPRVVDLSTALETYGAVPGVSLCPVPCSGTKRLLRLSFITNRVPHGVTQYPSTDLCSRPESPLPQVSAARLRAALHDRLDFMLQQAEAGLLAAARDGDVVQLERVLAQYSEANVVSDLPCNIRREGG